MIFMNKIASCLVILLAICKISSGQTLNISGTVKDINNKPMPLVSLTIEKQQNGIATDISGNFKLTIPKYSKLTFSSVGYKDTVVIINDESSLYITLRSTEKNLDTVTVTDYVHRAQTNNDLKREMVAADFLHYRIENNISTGVSVYEGSRVVNNRIENYHIVTDRSSSGIYQGTAFPEFHTKEDTKGSLYLFNNWYKGIIANNNDSNLIADTGNYYNVNKITGDLVMTRDFQSALNLDKSQVKFATLYDSLKNTYTFLVAPVINPTLLCQVISIGNSYDIFKLTTTKFKKQIFIQMVLPQMVIIMMNILMPLLIIF